MRCTDNTPPSKCLRHNHGIFTVEDAQLAADIYDYPGHHQNGSWCDCNGCADACLSGCTNPNKCFKHAKVLINQLHDSFVPLDSVLPVPLPDNITSLLDQTDPDLSWTPFSKNMNTTGNLSHNFRLMIMPLNIQPLDSATPMIITRPDGNTTETVVYINNHHTQKYLQAGCGLWFGNEDPRNSSLRIHKSLPQTANTADLLAVYHAAKIAPTDDTLCIITHIPRTVSTLTKNLPGHSDSGFYGIKDGNLLQATDAVLKNRQGHTLFGLCQHQNSAGILEALKLAKLGSQLPSPPTCDISAPTNTTSHGLKLATASQSLLYRNLQNRDPLPPRPRSTANIELVRNEAFLISGSMPQPTHIWLNIVHNHNLSRNVRTFLWKNIHEAHKCGPYWDKIAGYEDRSLCSQCGASDTIDHILFQCPQSAGLLIWPRVKALCQLKNIPWPTNFDLYTILASPFAVFRNPANLPRRGANRLFQIMVTEAAFLIWKLRCRRILDRAEHEPEKILTEAEVLRTFSTVLNNRLYDDRTMTNRQKYRSKAIPYALVLETWSGILHKESDLPHDWISKQNGVLVSNTTCRMNGRNR